MKRDPLTEATECLSGRTLQEDSGDVPFYFNVTDFFRTGMGTGERMTQEQGHAATKILQAAIDGTWRIFYDELRKSLLSNYSWKKELAKHGLELKDKRGMPVS